jgi:hypothetical protein
MADVFSYGVFIYIEIMLTAFGLLNIYYFQGVSLNEYLGLQGIALFSPNNTLFDLLSSGLGDFP